ncbi:hypothetical protein M3Y98_00352800 [Aphelenchoides besseyi]|nr:hypothetical protein M3Y98_00352800 [Aphelenchoides besseyi]
MDLLRPRRSVIVMAEDGGQPSRWTTIELTIETNIANWSFSAPFFPLPVYTAFVFESVRNATVILRSQATNKIGNSNGLNWRYSIVNNDEVFTISSLGEISIFGQLDYEKRSDYEFLVSVTDHQERSAIATVFVHVIGVDEYAPVFNRPSYSFQIPWTATVGQQVGRVQATDSDLGPNGGVVKYSLQDSLLKSIQIDSDSGILSIHEPLNRTENRTIEQVIVMAASGPIQLSRVPVELEFSDSAVLYVDENASTIIADRLMFGTICGIGFGLLIFCLLSCIFYIRKRDQKRKPRKQIYSVARGNLAVMTDVRRLSPSYSKSHFSSPSATIIPTTYSVASSSTSAIADERTATQSGNDTRVRMRDETILLNRSQPDSGIDADVLSIGSGITEYLNQMSKQSALPHSTADPLDVELLSGYYIDSCDTEKITEMSLNAYLRPTAGVVRASNQRSSQSTQMSSTFKERSH